MSESNESFVEKISPSQSRYLWVRKSDRAVQFWAKGVRECSLIKPTVPEHLNLVKYERGAQISAPKPFDYSIFEKRGILHSAITEQHAGFYTSRYKQDFSFMIFTINGSVEVNASKHKEVLKEGSLFLAPPNSYYELKAESSWKAYWFHLENSELWRGLVGKDILVRPAKYSSILLPLIEAYLAEVYCEDRSEMTIDSYADIICQYLRRELFENKAHKLEKFFSKNPFYLEDGTNAKSTAKKLGMSVSTLDKICLDAYGFKFAKFINEERMQKAKVLLLGNALPIDKIAVKLGFADRHSFSKAFKKYFKASPAAFKKNLGI